MKTKAWLIGIASLYVASLALPAWHTAFSNYWGLYCLIMVPYVLFYPAWWANPLLLAGCICLAREKILAARWLGLLAAALAGSFGVMAGPEALRVGYYAWTACMIGLVASAFERRHSGPVPGSPRNPNESTAIGRDELAHDASSPSAPAVGSSSSSSSSAPLSSRSPS